MKKIITLLLLFSVVLISSCTKEDVPSFIGEWSCIQHDQYTWPASDKTYIFTFNEDGTYSWYISPYMGLDLLMEGEWSYSKNTLHLTHWEASEVNVKSLTDDFFEITWTEDSEESYMKYQRIVPNMELR